MITLPNKTLKITVLENEYELKYPNTGGLIDIEIVKASLTNNRYEAISAVGSNASAYAKYTVDMIATFSTLCPQMKKDLKVQQFSDLDAMDSKKLLNIYIKQVIPWLNEWEVVLNSEEESEEKQGE